MTRRRSRDEPRASERFHRLPSAGYGHRSGMRIGYFLSTEEYGPHELIRQARLAEEAGFEALWISDHFHPWNDAQGQSPFVWSVIGAISQVCALPLTTAVTCPTVRLHPAVVAQAAATASVLLEGRFTQGVGSGEALNEHITGAGRPAQGGYKVCWSTDDDRAVAVAHRLWANSGLPGEAGQILPHPRHFEQLSSLVTESMTRESIAYGADRARHVDAYRPYLDAGFDEVYIAQMGGTDPGCRVEGFFDFYRDQVLPELRSMTPSAAPAHP